MGAGFRFKVKVGKSYDDGFEVEVVSQAKASLLQRVAWYAFGFATLAILAAALYGWLANDFSALKAIAEAGKNGVGVVMKLAMASGR